MTIVCVVRTLYWELITWLYYWHPRNMEHRAWCYSHIYVPLHILCAIPCYISDIPEVSSTGLVTALLLFVRQMRAANYITMLDPIQEKYGSHVCGLLYVPALCGDIFWVASILNALGKPYLWNLFKSCMGILKGVSYIPV